MPPRRRLERSGYRPGAISEDLRQAIAAEAASARAVEGLIARIDATSDAIAAIEDAVDEIREVRLSALVALRGDGWSYDRIAAASTLSKSRVRQLAHEARDRGLLENNRVPRAPRRDQPDQTDPPDRPEVHD